MIVLNLAVSELFNQMGVGIAGNFELFGIFILLAIFFILLMFGLPLTLVLGMVGMILIVLYGIWGGLFKQFAVIVSIIFGIAVTNLIMSLFRDGVR